MAPDALADSSADVRALDEDARLVARAQRGDRAAYGALFTRHHGRVRALCSRMLRDPVEVEDAVQQVFLEGWRCLHRFEGRSRFTTWLTRIAIHTCFGLRRRLRRWFIVEPGAPAFEAATPAQAQRSPDDVATNAARQRALDDVVRRLSDKKRVVFVLCDLEGLTSPEVASLLSVPEATVRTRLFHARRELAALARQHDGLADLFADRTTPTEERP